MDRYLIKTSREKPEKDVRVASSSKSLTQSTIHSLQGVVVIEDIHRLKSKLQLPNQSKPILIDSLRELGEKIPPRNVMLSTKIGHTVNKLRKHPDEEVVREAKKVYSKWKTHFQDFKDRPKIEVKCDKKAENLRLRGKTFLAEALDLERTHAIVEAIERETFHQSKRLVSPSYRRTLRSLIFKLKNTEKVKMDVINGEISVEDLVKQHKKS